MGSANSNIVLVAGPFVRASSWGLTATFLEDLGHEVRAPDVLADQTLPPAWRDWTAHLIRHVSPCNRLVLVGHSSAGPLVADLAGKLDGASIVIVDGHIPPSHGLAPPVRPALREFIESLPAPHGVLPIWSRWFSGDADRRAVIGLDRLARDPSAFAAFESELRAFPADWIEDEIMLDDWHHVPAGFIQTSDLYDYAADDAQRRGWAVIRLQGTHLHPLLEPAEMADAIHALIGQLAPSAIG